MTEHLLPLQVLVTLLSAPLCVVLRRPGLVRFFATAMCATACLVSCGLYADVSQGVQISYHLGAWQPPWGIELRADSLTVLLLLIITFIATAVIAIGIGPRSHRVPPGKEAFFYAAYLLCVTGLLGMTVTADAFNVFVFLEISSLSTYALIALGAGRRALTAAFSYLVVGTIGGTFILLGIGLLYQMTGSLNMADIAELLVPLKESRTLPVAFGFLMVGLGLKVAVFPLHQWLPNAYAFAPSSVSAFIAGTATKVIYYLMLRFAFTVFGMALVFESIQLSRVLMPLSLLAMFAGSIAAIYQTDFKRLLAYSSVAQLGYLTLAFSLGSSSGVQAGLVHVFNHAIMKSGLFLVAAAIVAAVGSAKLRDMAGLGKKMPLTMAALVVGGLGLIGVPGTGGFISKWYLVVAALQAGSVALAGLILVSSLLAVVYVWRLIELVYFKAAESDAPASQDLRDRPALLLPAWGLMAASVYFGIFTELPSELSRSAAVQLTSKPAPLEVRGVAKSVHAAGEQGDHDQPSKEGH